MSTSGTGIVTKLDRPVGICPRCRAVVRSFDQIGRKCARPLPSGTMCPGVIRSALTREEWSECPSCLATGHIDDGACTRCNGEGWIYVRR
jgi:DnaJ-class molecular chaperone